MEYFEVSINTTTPMAAIDATFTYDADMVEIVPNETVFYGSDNTLENSFKINSAGSIKLVLLGDVEAGTTQWVTFRFKVLETGEVTFNLTDALVSNVDEEFVTVVVNSKTINVSTEGPTPPSYTISIPSGVKDVTGAGSTLLGEISLVEGSTLPENGLIITAVAANESKLIKTGDATKNIPFLLTSNIEQAPFAGVTFTNSGANAAGNIYAFVTEGDWSAADAGSYTGNITFTVAENS